ncbi:MAG: hypothetical protein Q7T74_07455 [Candidatus Saccharibacteria bacterium]|nr:hypothetical protein [Candidatus Saccharibacteria bacterium]
MSIQRFDHHIQAEIFAKLRHSPTLRYKDLKNPELESSQFMYHLRELIKLKLVEKTDDGYYKLAPKGVELAQHFSSEVANLQEAPLTYSLIFLRTKTKKWFVSHRKRHPFIGKYACISGKVHMQETLRTAAKRELSEFSKGKIDIPLIYSGYVSVLVHQKNALNHVTGPVWFADNLEEIELPEINRGDTKWVEWEKIDYNEFIPGWREIVEMIESGKSDYLDLEFDV